MNPFEALADVHLSDDARGLGFYARGLGFDWWVAQQTELWGRPVAAWHERRLRCIITFSLIVDELVKL